jgi:hypothetical protein
MSAPGTPEGKNQSLYLYHQKRNGYG